MKICVLSANMGAIDNPQNNVKQTIDYHYHLFNETNFPPRDKTMSPRLQARLAKMFGWQLVPGYDIYLWVDSSCRLAKPDAIEWFLKELGDNDIAVFKHPNRNTVQEEGDYMQHRLDIGCPYITPRYQNEDIKGQLEEVDPSAQVYATTCMIYRNTPEVRAALKECWYHITRYHTNEQLSFPYSTRHLKVKAIEVPYMKSGYLEYIRVKK